MSDLKAKMHGAPYSISIRWGSDQIPLEELTALSVTP